MSSTANHRPSLAQYEQDIAHPQSGLSDDDYLEPHMNTSHRKGKGKSRSGHTDPTTSDSSSENLDKMAYPPTNDDAEETRRVEENLRRWEIAERQRRKAARGSTQSAKGPSLIDDVSRRASLLWSGNKTKHSSIGGSHTALESQDHVDIVPLNQVATASPVLSPARNSDESNNRDPFANPLELISPFADSFQVATLAPPSASEDDKHLSAPSNTANVTNASNSIVNDTLKRQKPPAPMPLNLPPPRIPPMSPTLLSPTSEADARHRKEPERVRWWHEWLCGCSEGPDRGGDYQAGRTNPQE